MSDAYVRARDGVAGRASLRGGLGCRAAQGIPAGDGAPGAPSLGYLSWQDKKGNQLPGCPRRPAASTAEPIRNAKKPYPATLTTNPLRYAPSGKLNNTG